MKNSADNLIVTIFYRRAQLSDALISAVYLRLREELTRHFPALGHVTIFGSREKNPVPVAPDRTIAIFENAAVVAGRRLAVVVGGVHAVRFVLRALYLGAVEGPRLAFRTTQCVGEVAGVDRTIRGVGVPARRS